MKMTMKTLMRNTLLTLPLLLIAMTAKAQDSYFLGTYQISIPQGDTNDYLGGGSPTSYRGFGFDIRFYSGNDGRLTLGGGSGWNIFESGGIFETITIRNEDFNGDITGTQFRYINAVPLMFQVHYHFGRPDDVHAYVGTGIGTYYIRQRFEVGLFATEVSNWHFGIAPEGGVNFPLSDSVSFNANVRYNFAANSGSDIQGNETGHSYLAFNVGLSFFTGF